MVAHAESQKELEKLQQTNSALQGEAGDASRQRDEALETVKQLNAERDALQKELDDCQSQLSASRSAAEGGTCSSLLVLCNP